MMQKRENVCAWNVRKFSNIKLYVFVFTIDNDLLVFVSLKLLFRDDLLSKKVR